MIELFEGRVGNGKTYSAVVRALNQWSKGGVVVSNIEFIPEGCAAYLAKHYGLLMEPDQLQKLTRDQMGEFHKHLPWGSERGKGQTRVLALFDEVHLYLNARDTMQAAKNVRQLFDFVTQSDKMSIDLVFISQSAENIDKQLRRLFDYLWRFRDMSKFKLPFVGRVWPFDDIRQTQIDFTGLVCDKFYLRKQPDVFACYRTGALLSSFSSTDAKTQFTLRKVPKKKPMRVILIAVVLAVVLLFTYGPKLYYTFMGAPKVADVKPHTPSKEQDHKPRDAERSQELPLPAEYVSVENFRAESGDVLRTDRAEYRLHTWSQWGYVTGYIGNVLWCRTQAGVDQRVLIQREGGGGDAVAFQAGPRSASVAAAAPPSVKRQLRRGPIPVPKLPGLIGMTAKPTPSFLNSPVVPQRLTP